MNENRMWFVGLRNKHERVTIQSVVAASLDEAIEKVLANPVLEDVVAYYRMESAEDVRWININED